MTVASHPEIPTPEERELAKELSRKLAKRGTSHDLKIMVEPDDGSGDYAVIPQAAFKLLMDILTAMGEGRAVSIIPHRAELTTKQAADMLNVSRPFLIKLLEQEEIPFHMVGTHRRIKFEDLVEYKNNIDAKRLKTLEELSAEAQDMGFY
jgi:excisionase family DNA binding protein